MISHDSMSIDFQTMVHMTMPKIIFFCIFEVQHIHGKFQKSFAHCGHQRAPAASQIYLIQSSSQSHLTGFISHPFHQWLKNAFNSRSNCSLFGCHSSQLGIPTIHIISCPISWEPSQERWRREQKNSGVLVSLVVWLLLQYRWKEHITQKRSFSTSRNGMLRKICRILTANPLQPTCSSNRESFPEKKQADNLAELIIILEDQKSYYESHDPSMGRLYIYLHNLP